MLRHSFARVLLAASIVLPLTPAAFAQEGEPQSLASTLPPGPGRDTIVTVCTGCHSLDRLSFATKTRAQWHDTVLQMVSNGAQLFPDEIDSVTNYLATNMGKPDKAPSEKK